MRIGTAIKRDDIFFLKRIPLNSFDDLAFFMAKLEAGYDWLHKFHFILLSAGRHAKKGMKSVDRDRDLKIRF